MSYQNKSPFGTILRDTNIYNNLESMTVIETSIQNTKIYVQMTEEKNGEKYHYKVTLILLNIMNNYIYLIQTREFKNMNQNVYKIGKTKQDNLTRINQYPKGSQLLLQQICHNCDILESLIIKEFRDKYIHRKDIGNEYFQGCYYEMIKDIHNKIITCMKDYKVEDIIKKNRDNVEDINKENIEKNNIQNQINNNIKIKYIINNINSLSISHIKLKELYNIINSGLNCLSYLIEKINFNKLEPRNHIFYTSSLNSNYVYILKNNKVIKTNKTTFFDKVLLYSLKILESFCQNNNFILHEIEKFEKKFLKLKELLFTGNSGLKIFYRELNLLSYNNKNLIINTWKQVKNSDNSEQNAIMDIKKNNTKINYIRSKYEIKINNNYDTDIE